MTSYVCFPLKVVGQIGAICAFASFSGSLYAGTGSQNGKAVTSAVDCGPYAEWAALDYSPETATIDTDAAKSRYAVWKIGFANPGTYTLKISGSEKYAVRAWTWPASAPKQWQAKGGRWPSPDGDVLSWELESRFDQSWIGLVHVYPIGEAANKPHGYALRIQYPDCAEVNALKVGSDDPQVIAQRILASSELSLAALPPPGSSLVKSKPEFNLNEGFAYCKKYHGREYFPATNAGATAYFNRTGKYECARLKPGGQLVIPACSGGKCPEVPAYSKSQRTTQCTYMGQPCVDRDAPGGEMQWRAWEESRKRR